MQDQPHLTKKNVHTSIEQLIQKTLLYENLKFARYIYIANLIPKEPIYLFGIKIIALSTFDFIVILLFYFKITCFRRL